MPRKLPPGSYVFDLTRYFLNSIHTDYVERGLVLQNVHKNYPVTNSKGLGFWTEYTSLDVHICSQSMFKHHIWVNTRLSAKMLLLVAPTKEEEKIESITNAFCSCR